MKGDHKICNRLPLRKTKIPTIVHTGTMLVIFILVECGIEFSGGGDESNVTAMHALNDMMRSLSMPTVRSL